MIGIIPSQEDAFYEFIVFGVSNHLSSPEIFGEKEFIRILARPDVFNLMLVSIGNLLLDIIDEIILTSNGL